MGDPGSELEALAAAVAAAPQDPLARRRLVEHCREEVAVTSRLLEVLADLARSEEGREEVLGEGLLGVLVARVEVLDGEAMAVQACRLGGNLCFDSPEGREAVEAAGLLHLLTSTIATSSSLPHTSRLWTILPAFLHNYCADHPSCLVGVVEVVAAAALHYTTLLEEDATVEAWASFLSGLSEHEGRILLFSRPAVLGSVLHLLHLTTDREIAAVLLELIQELCDDETLACQALELGLLPLLLARVGEGEEEEESVVLDILALLSSHPEALEALLHHSSPLPPLLPAWLASAQGRRAAAAALVYGNYCTRCLHAHLALIAC